MKYFKLSSCMVLFFSLFSYGQLAQTLGIDFESPVYNIGILSGQDGWQTASGTYSNGLDVRSGSGGYFTHGSIKPSAEIFRLIGSLAYNFEVHIDMRSSGFSVGESTAGNIGLVMLGNDQSTSSFNNGGIIFGWANRNGSVQFVACNGSEWWEAANYSVTSDWDTFKIESNVSSQTFSVYVDTNGSGSWQQITFRKSGTSSTLTSLNYYSGYSAGNISAIRLHSSVSHTNKYVEWDNIKLYESIYSNLVVNNGFEDSFNAWTQTEPQSDFISLDNTYSYAGNYSAKMYGVTGQEYIYLQQDIYGIDVGAEYTLSAWFMGEPSVGDGTSGGIGIYFYDINNNVLEWSWKTQLPTGTTTWTQIYDTAKVPYGTAYVRVFVRLFGYGPVWFDDVEFVQTTEAPFVVFEKKRLALEPGQLNDFSSEIVFSEDVTDDYVNQLTWQLFSADSESYYSDLIPSNLSRTASDTFTADFSLPVLDPNDYYVKVIDSEANEANALEIFVTSYNRKPHFLTDDGIIMRAGKKIFPVGLYGVSLSSYNLLAPKGFNVVQGWQGNDTITLESKVNEAEGYDISIGFHLYGEAGNYTDNIPNSLNKINQFGGRPGILSWWIADEPELQDESKYESLPEYYRTLKSADSLLPMEITMAETSEYEFGVKFCDVLKIDPYWYPGNTVEKVATYTKQAVQAVEPWQPVYVILQAGYQTNPANQPPYNECRVAMYLSIIHGAKGVLWFTYDMGDWYLPSTQLWSNFGGLNAETSFIGDNLINSQDCTNVDVLTSQTYLHHKVFEDDDNAYLLLANTSESSLVVNFSTSSEYDGVIAYTGSSVTRYNRNFSVILPAMGADTIILTKPSKPVICAEIDFQSPYWPGVLAGQRTWTSASGAFSDGAYIYSDASNAFVRGSQRSLFHALRSLASQIDSKGEIEFDMRSQGFDVGDLTGGTIGFFTLGNSIAVDSLNNCGLILGWANINGTVQFGAYSGSVFCEATNYGDSQDWDQFRVLFDVNSRIYSVQVDQDGNGIYQDIVFHNSQTGTDIAELGFYSGYTGMTLDAVRLYSAVDDTSKFVDWDNIVVYRDPENCQELQESDMGKPEDINKDCIVDLQDLLELSKKWLN